MMESSASRRKPKIGYSYPSHQDRQGPAPLASFEDLPSDDQASPEDERCTRDLSPDQDVIEKALESDVCDLLVSSPTKTLTPISFCSPDECERRSGSATPTGDQPPLSPGGERGQAWSDLRVASHASKQRKEDRAGAWTEVRKPDRRPPDMLPESERTQAWQDLRQGTPVKPPRNEDRAVAWNEVRKPDRRPPDMPPDSERTQAWQDLRKGTPVKPPRNEERAVAWGELRTFNASPRAVGRDGDDEEKTPTSSGADGEEDAEQRRQAWEELRKFNASPRTVAAARATAADPERSKAWEEIRKANCSPLSTSPNDTDRARAWEEIRKLNHSPRCAGDQGSRRQSVDRALAWQEVRRVNHSPLQESVPSHQRDSSMDESRALAWDGLRRGQQLQEQENVESRKQAWDEVRKVGHSPTPMSREQEERAKAWSVVRKLSHGDQPTLERPSPQLGPPSEESEVPSKSPSPTTKRKGSWTDIFFRGRSRSRSKSPNDNCADGDIKCPEEPAKRERKRSSIFSLFSSKKERSQSNSSPKQGEDVISPDQVSSPTPRELSTPRVSVTDTSCDGGRCELILMAGSDDHDVVLRQKPDDGGESQQDTMIEIAKDVKREKQSEQEGAPQQQQQNFSGSEINAILLQRTLKRRSDTIDPEVQSLPEELPSVRRRDKEFNEAYTKKEETVVKATIERRPSEGDSEDTCSERGNGGDGEDESTFREPTTYRDDDTEAANLLTQDSIEYEDTSAHHAPDSLASESAHSQRSAPMSQLLKSKDRQEVAIASVDRPRSTTPIGIAPLEEFIRRSSLSPDPSAERIKLSLPGEQFNASTRSKSPRKSNPAIWLDFCEKGLQSPRSSRKNKHKNKHKMVEAGGLGLGLGHQEPSTIPVSITPNDAFTPVTDTPLTPVTPLEDEEAGGPWNTFQDSFDPGATMDQEGEALLPNLPSECNKCDCRFMKGLSGFGDGSCLASPITPITPPLPLDTHPLDDDEAESLLPPSSSSLRALLTVQGGALPSTGAVSSSDEHQPLVSPNLCTCNCHSDFSNMLWQKANLRKQDSVLSGSSDISSASSRLINSSSSDSLKCSLVGTARAQVPIT